MRIKRATDITELKLSEQIHVVFMFFSPQGHFCFVDLCFYVYVCSHFMRISSQNPPFPTGLLPLSVWNSRSPPLSLMTLSSPGRYDIRDVSRFQTAFYSLSYLQRLSLAGKLTFAVSVEPPTRSLAVYQPLNQLHLVFLRCQAGPRSGQGLGSAVTPGCPTQQTMSEVQPISQTKIINSQVTLHVRIEKKRD